MTSLESFMEPLNNNTLGISLQYEASLYWAGELSSHVAKIGSQLIEVGNMARAAILCSTSKSKSNDEDHNFSIVTTYSQQYYDIKKIMSKQWAVLKNDRVLGPVLPDHPKVFFRDVPPLKLDVAPNRVSFFSKIKVFFFRAGSVLYAI